MNCKNTDVSQFVIFKIGDIGILQSSLLGPMFFSFINFVVTSTHM